MEGNSIAISHRQNGDRVISWWESGKEFEALALLDEDFFVKPYLVTFAPMLEIYICDLLTDGQTGIL